jgi:large subunit ribosomal protein L23
MKNARDIIKRPIVTERSTEMMEDNKYVFEVDVRSNKTEIKKAVEEIFDVKVVSVNTLNRKPKPKTFGRYRGYTARRKMAVVKLSEDSKTLEFFEGA